MCGICGILGLCDEQLIRAMNGKMTHRGPDEDGFYFGEKLCLANRRLSIIDLSTGKQPIFNEDDSIVVVYNGEIYNFQSLRENLINKGHIFTTKTDTEVIVHAYEEFGKDCLKHFNGNFAFALYDKNQDEVFIARDRAGIRPLYYYQQGNKLFFASELKALLVNNDLKRDLNYQSVDRYLTLRYNSGEETFFKNVKKLPPGHFMTYRDGNISIQKYWELGFDEIKLKSLNDYCERFQELFENSVKLRMISDVPFGAFLSGGLDSSFIVAMMAKHSNQPVETYSMGFNLDIDETSEARATADFFGCNHHEIFINKQSYDLLPEIISYFDEPLGDSIIIPTYLLAKAASKDLKVVLTGEGADEIFGGYVHHQVMHYGSLYRKLIPKFIHNNLILPSTKIAPLQLLDKLFPYPSDLGKKGKEKLITYLSNINNITDSYFSIASVYNNTDKYVFYNKLFNDNIHINSSFDHYKSYLSDIKTSKDLNKLIGLDFNYWLADYTLYKQDRLTMANSIEGRIPYLDHNLVEFVAGIPLKYKLNGLNTKYLLRKVAKSFLPQSTAFKSKKAFYYPYQNCFEDDFNSYLLDLFDKNSFIINMNLINRDMLINLCKNSLNNELIKSKQLMSLIILEHWLRIYT